MLEMTFEWKPILEEVDYRTVGEAVDKAAEVLALAMGAALNGTTFAGMTGAVHLKDATVSHQSLGEFEAVVNFSDLTQIEEGTKPWDQKPSLLAGPRHRVAKDGDRYNIIPFFHDRDKMPNSIGLLADGLDISSVIGSYIDGLGVERNTYAWGTSLPNVPAVSLSILDVAKTGYMHMHSKYSGMVNMSGAGFMTFRTVSDKSPPESWWNPGKPGNPVSESVWKALYPAIEGHIMMAWEQVFDAW